MRASLANDKTKLNHQRAIIESNKQVRPSNYNENQKVSNLEVEVGKLRLMGANNLKEKENKLKKLKSQGRSSNNNIMIYRKRDNPGKGLCAYYSLFGIMHPDICWDGRDNKVYIQSIINHHTFNANNKHKINNLIKNPSRYMTLGGKDEDIANPSWALRHSPSIAKHLAKTMPYYMIIHPPGRFVPGFKNNREILNALRDAQSSNNGLRQFIDKGVEVGKYNPNYNAYDMISSEDNHAVHNIRYALRKGKVAIFRGTGGHWYIFEPILRKDSPINTLA